MNRLFSPMSPFRKTYFLRLAGRCAVLLLCALLYLRAPQAFELIHGWNFFDHFSILHVLWVIWVLDMVQQLVPTKLVPLGSQKNFQARFRPGREASDSLALKAYITKATRAAGNVFVLWTVVVCAIGVLFRKGFLDAAEVFLCSAFFYVCDLICVLIWCPFRFLMKNRCCTSCRIFNWDHLMMFSPFLFVWSFYTTSLLLVSIAVVIVWEICIILHPERFWEYSNAALQCANCTDKLCTQYCQKLRKK